MEKIIYDAARVKEAYAKQHPERQVLRVYKDRTAALMYAAATPGGTVDLSYGFYVVTGAPDRVCAGCGDRYTEADIKELAECGERCFKGRGFFLCPDCYDAFTRLDLEDQEAYLLGLKKEALA